MKINSKIILIVILLIAAFFRFYLLNNVPPSASLDEASIGWNAFSIIQTGKDEYGSKFPILLRAYDDYRPALYVYTVIPFIKIFGLDVLSVRLPSVILSLLTVFATYFLTKEIFKKQKFFNPEHIALASAFLLAISPWHIYISRLGHEVNLAFSSFIFALLFFTRRNIYLSALFFVISFISYQTEKLFIPVLLLGILVIYYKELLKFEKQILISIIFSLIILFPFVKETFSPNALIRLKGTNTFELNKSRYIDQTLLLEKAAAGKDYIGEFIYNRRLVTVQIFSENYLSHFNPVWLFTNALGDWHKIPGIGLLYIWEFPLILLGIYVFIRFDFDKKNKALIFLWFLISPLAASIATDTPHALRTLVFIPTWQIFSSLGFVYLLSLFKNSKNKNIFIGMCSFILFLTISSLYRQYFYVFPKTQSDSFQYALSKVIPYAVKNKDQYKKIVFTNNVNLSQSYMFFLFYTKYDPKLYQSQGGTVSGGFDAIHKFGKYEFRPIDMGKEASGNLYIGNYAQFYLKGDSVEQVKGIDIKNLNGENTIKIVTK